MARESRIGVVHWEALDVLRTGDQFVLEIPAYFEEPHVPYLESILRSKLPDVFGKDTVVFTLVAGELQREPGRTSYEPGRILIEEVSQPWPDADALRQALEDAFVEAAEVEVRQGELAKELVRHLRAADKPS